jgi:hypothetical protein
MSPDASNGSSGAESDLSGVGIALGILAAGLLLQFEFDSAFSNGTAIVSSALIVIGTAMFLIELGDNASTPLGLDNAGVGVLLFVPAFWLLGETSSLDTAWLRYLANSVLLAVLILGACGILDGVTKIMRSFFEDGSLVESVIKSIGLLITLVGSAVALANQLDVL